MIKDTKNVHRFLFLLNFDKENKDFLVEEEEWNETNHQVLP